MAQISLSGYISSDFEKIKYSGVEFLACMVTCEKGQLVLPVCFDYYHSKLLKRDEVGKGFLLNLTLLLKSKEVLTTKGEKKLRIHFICIDYEVVSESTTKIPSTDYLSKLLMLESMTNLKREIKEEKKNGKK